MELQQQGEADHHTSTVNWLQPLTCQQLESVQKDGPVLSILHNWKESEVLPTREQVTIESPAVRKYWLCWPQIELHQGVLHYRWENADRSKPSLLLLVLISLQTDVMLACHNPPQPGHLGETKTLQRLRQSYHWYGVGGDLSKYIQRCPQCKARK